MPGILVDGGLRLLSYRSQRERHPNIPGLHPLYGFSLTALSEDTAHMGQFGLLSSDVRQALMQITSWHVPATEPYGKQFDLPDFFLYSSSRREDSDGLMAV